MTGQRKARAALAALLAGMLLLAACGEGEEGADPGAATPDEPGQDTGTESATGSATEAATEAGGGDDPAGPTEAAGGALYDDVVRLTFTTAPVPPSMTSLSVGVAQEEGLFEKWGLDVDFRIVDSGVTSFRGLEGRLADVGIASAIVQVNAAAQGTNVRLIYGATQYAQHQLLVHADEVSGCEDLEGKVLAIDQIGGFLEMLNRQFLATCGLTPDDVTYAPVGGGSPQALLEHQVATATIQPERIRQLELEFPDEDLTTVTNFWETVPLMWGHGWASTEEMLADPEKREGLIRFVGAMIEANEFMYDEANRDRVIEITNTFTGTTEPEAAAHGYDLYHESGLWPEPGEHGIRQDQVDWTVDFSVEIGNIAADAAPAYEDLVDLSVWEEAQERYEAQQ